MRVAGQTRRKAAYMEVMEVCAKLKRARDLQHSLKWVRDVAWGGRGSIGCVVEATWEPVADGQREG